MGELEWWVAALCIGILLLVLPWDDPPTGGYYDDEGGF